MPEPRPSAGAAGDCHQFHWARHCKLQSLHCPSEPLPGSRRRPFELVDVGELEKCHALSGGPAWLNYGRALEIARRAIAILSRALGVLRAFASLRLIHTSALTL
jgi:hypothetical protein